VIVRFEGNNAELGVKTLEESGVDIIAATGLNDAVQRAVKAAGEVA
jgi:succinyl-CoA synthetase beta subunit